MGDMTLPRVVQGLSRQEGRLGPQGWPSAGEGLGSQQAMLSPRAP